MHRVPKRPPTGEHLSEGIAGHSSGPLSGQTQFMPDRGSEARPGLTLMPEYGVDIPVWFGPDGDDSGGLSAEDLAALGVSDRLIERLRAWQESWDHDPSTSDAPRGSWPGSPVTVRLAQHLQAELPAYRIFLFAEPAPRPVDEWTD
jgi:hypothetical protein